MNIQQEKVALNKIKCLKPYTKHQLENWKGSNKIMVYENEEQLKSFIESAKENLVSNKKLYFGIIPDEISERVERECQITIKEYNCSIRACEIRKILKSHGNVKYELDRGQQAVTELDFRNIPEVIINPDKIEDGGMYHDKKVLKFTKADKTVVGIVSRKHLDLYVQTMYIRQKNKSLATTPGDDKIFPHTSETLSGTALNNRSLATATDEQASVNTPETTRSTASNNIISEMKQNTTEN